MLEREEESGGVGIEEFKVCKLFHGCELLANRLRCAGSVLVEIETTSGGSPVEGGYEMIRSSHESERESNV